MSSTTISLQLETSTPLLQGWYDPNLADQRWLRPTEVKGVWRWWSRAVVAGVLFDNGYIVGRAGGECVVELRNEEAKAITCYVGKIFGLGYASESGSEASRHNLFIRSVITGKAPHSLTNLQRVKLLTIGGRTVEYIPPGTRYTLEIEVRHRYRDAELLALKIILLALQFMGIGKGSRRGLGSVDISMDSRALDYLGAPKSVSELVKDIYEEAEDIVKRYPKECSLDKLQTGAQALELPPVPALSRKYLPKGLCVSPMYVYKDVQYNKFVGIHNFFVRSERCRTLYGTPVCNDDLRSRLSAWVLGLPREQRGTGYAITSKNITRRASPLTIAFHSKNNVFGSGVFLSLFISGDWPKELMWSDGFRTRINIDINNILEAHRVLQEELNSYLEKLGLNSLDEVRIWPRNAM